MPAGTAKLRTRMLDFGGFDSSRILDVRGGMLMSMGFSGKSQSTQRRQSHTPTRHIQLRGSLRQLSAPPRKALVQASAAGPSATLMATPPGIAPAPRAQLAAQALVSFLF